MSFLYCEICKQTQNSAHEMSQYFNNNKDTLLKLGMWYDIKNSILNTLEHFDPVISINTDIDQNRLCQI